MEHQKWPSIPRLYRDCVVTEKIDGTNAAIGIIDMNDETVGGINQAQKVADNPRQVIIVDQDFAVYAQSRTRVITPEADNHGFATWVYEHSTDLIKALGTGLHFGEWWGSGINRGYGLEKGEKRFSLFNTKRWAQWVSAIPNHFALHGLPNVDLVPILWEGDFAELTRQRDGNGETELDQLVRALEIKGSVASPGFRNPEGVVIFHKAANHCFKYTPFDGDGHKGGS